MKPTAACQIIEAVFKMVFGLLFARFSMGCFMSNYYEYGTVLVQRMKTKGRHFRQFIP